MILKKTAQPLSIAAMNGRPIALEKGKTTHWLHGTPGGNLVVRGSSCLPGQPAPEVRFDTFGLTTSNITIRETDREKTYRLLQNFRLEKLE